MKLSGPVPVLYTVSGTETESSQLTVNKMESGAHDPFGRRVMDAIEASDKPLTLDEILAARRAYYANTSYFDSKVGESVKTIEEMGEADNTIIIVTADHGDMLGERGLWFKMNFFEHSARIPLIMAGPGVAQGVAPNACSLLDMLPTFVDAAGGTREMFGDPVDGRSLMPLARGDADPVDEAIGEYCAEMTPWPVYMIVRRGMKYIHCEVDPPQLYNLDADPYEKVNLASDPAYAGAAEDFAAEVVARWDCAALRAEVMRTQSSRFKLHAAMQAGAGEAWDYNPPRDASQEYVRNHMDWAAATARYRFPPVDGN